MENANLILQYRMTCQQCQEIVQAKEMELQQIQAQLNPETARIIKLNRELKDLNEEASKVKKNIANSGQKTPQSQQSHSPINNLIQTIRAARIVYTRRENIEKSIEALEEVKKFLEDKEGEVQTRLYEARQWAKETEADRESKLLEQVKKEKEILKKLNEEKEKQAKDLVDASKDTRINISNRDDLELLAAQYDKIIYQIQYRMQQLKAPEPGSQIAQYANYIDQTIQGLQSRFQQYYQVFIQSCQLDRLKSQNDTLYHIFKKSFKNYKGKYNELKKLHEEAIKNQNFCDTLRNQYKNEEENYKKEEANLDLIKKQRDNKKLELENIRHEIEAINNERLKIEKSCTKEKFDKFNQYFEIKKLNEEQKSKAEQEKQNHKVLEYASKEAMEIFNIFQKNIQFPTKVKECTESYYKLMCTQLNNIKQMISTGSQSKDDHSTELRTIFNELRKKMVVEVKENIDEVFHNPELRNLKGEAVQYSKDPERVVVEWATLAFFTKLLFVPENLEPNFTILHIFSWHNARKTPQEVADILLKIFLDCQNGQPIQNGFPIIQQADAAAKINNYIEKWVGMFPEDFLEVELDDPNKKLEKPLQWKTLLNYIKDFCSAEETQKLIESKIQVNPLRTSLPLAQVTNEKIKVKGEYFGNIKSDALKNTIPFAAGARHIANHLMYVDLKLFNAINYKEFVACGWSNKTNATQISPNVVKLSQRFNKISQYIQYTIVNFVKNDPGECANIIAQWVLIMYYCKEINNFHGLFIIDAALSAPPVNRLTAAWEILEKVQGLNNKTIKELHSSLSSYCSPLRKFKNYKTAISQVDPAKAFPFMGPWQTDMTFIKDGNPRSRNEGEWELLNITMHRAYWAAASYLKKDWGTGCDFLIDPELEKAIEELDTGSTVIDEAYLLNKSVECEPDK